MNCIDGRHSAESTTRRGKDMPRQLCKIYPDIRREEKIDRIARGVAWVRSNLRDLAAIADETFAEQESRAQFFIVPGSAHGDADRPGLDLDFQGLFRGEGIGGANGL